MIRESYVNPIPQESLLYHLQIPTQYMVWAWINPTNDKCHILWGLTDEDKLTLSELMQKEKQRH